MKYFPGFNTLQLSEQVKRLLFRLDETPENFTAELKVLSLQGSMPCKVREQDEVEGPG